MLSAGPARRQTLTGGEAIWRGHFMAGASLARQRGDADHEELVEVVGRNRQELDAFEERVGVRLRLCEDALVEGQPAELAVDVQRRICQVRRVGHERTLCNRPAEAAAGNRDVRVNSVQLSGAPCPNPARLLIYMPPSSK